MARRRIVPTGTQINQQDELIAFMERELGGKQRVLELFYADKIRRLAATKATLADLYASARAEGWTEHLSQMAVGDLGVLCGR